MKHKLTEVEKKARNREYQRRHSEKIKKEKEAKAVELAEALKANKEILKEKEKKNSKSTRRKFVF